MATAGIDPDAGTDGAKTVALEAAYREHGAAVLRLSRGLCGPTVGAEVCQDVFVSLWQHPERFDPSRGSLRTYLLTKARSRAIDVIRADRSRRRREDRATLDHDRRSDPGAEVTQLEDRIALRGPLDGLPLDERRAVVLAFYGEQTYREVAHILGEPEGTTKSRIRRGLTRLSASLDPAV